MAAGCQLPTLHGANKTPAASCQVVANGLPAGDLIQAPYCLHTLPTLAAWMLHCLHTRYTNHTSRLATTSESPSSIIMSRIFHPPNKPQTRRIRSLYTLHPGWWRPDPSKRPPKRRPALPGAVRPRSGPGPSRTPIDVSAFLYSILLHIRYLTIFATLTLQFCFI